ncbi:UNVERIFIED_CONTAM: hypothetical protein HDU68_009324, partial [Siphonaria sp. JEL0065]
MPALTEIPSDVLSSLLVGLHPTTLETLALTSKSLRHSTKSLQESNWFALQNMRHVIAEIKGTIHHLYKNNIVESETDPIPSPELEGYFTTTWQHTFWRAHMHKIKFSRLPVSYTVALLRLTGFTCRSLGALGLQVDGASTTSLIRWRNTSFSRVQNRNHVELAMLQLMNGEYGDWTLEKNCDLSLLFVWACAAGSFEIVRVVASNPQYWSEVNDIYGLATITAAGLGHLGILRYLVEEHHVDPSTGHNGALEWAAKSGHLDVIEYLLKDERVDPADASSMALVWACKNGHLDIVRRLLEDGRSDPTAQSNSALISAARHGFTEIVTLLLQDERVDVNTQEGHVLLSPSIQGHAETVEILLKAGADPKLSKFKPFQIALHAGNSVIVKAYLKYSNDWFE